MPVYLILSPYLRNSDKWPRWRQELALLLPGQQLVCWADLPAGFLEVPPADRQARLARVFSAAVVVPEKHGPRIRPRRLGRVAAAKAAAFHAAGKPVQVYAAGTLIPWAACQLSETHKGPRCVPLEILTPQLVKAARTKASQPAAITGKEIHHDPATARADDRSRTGGQDHSPLRAARHMVHARRRFPRPRHWAAPRRVP